MGEEESQTVPEGQAENCHWILPPKDLTSGGCSRGGGFPKDPETPPLFQTAGHNLFGLHNGPGMLQPAFLRGRVRQRKGLERVRVDYMQILGQELSFL